MITREELHELFKLREDGRFIWKVKPAKNIKIGDVAGSLDKNGYRYIGIYGKYYKEHRLIWIYHNEDIPEDMCIDHINRITDDNRIGNLRLVTKQENNWNTSAKGYSWHKLNNKWQAYININGKRKFLGYFDNKKDAHQAYLDAKQIYHIIENRSPNA